jgi:uncharacterized protein YidB (DUF937 family)
MPQDFSCGFCLCKAANALSCSFKNISRQHAAHQKRTQMGNTCLSGNYSALLVALVGNTRQANRMVNVGVVMANMGHAGMGHRTGFWVGANK